MYARLAAFQGGNSDGMRKLAGEQMKSEQPFPDGVKRAVLLATPDGDRRLFITFFEDADALRAAEPAFEKMGDHISESVRGQRIAVESYEVLLEWPA